MFNTNTGYSLADIAAATGTKEDGFFGGNNGWWIILLFLFAGWGGGFGNNGRNNENSIRDEIAYSFDFNGLENGVRGIQQGLCDGFYAVNTGMLNGFSGVQSALCQGFSGINGAITEASYATQGSLHDIALGQLNNTNSIHNAIADSTTALTAQLTNMAANNAMCCCETKGAIKDGFCELNYNLATQACDTRRAIADSTRDIIEFLTQDKIATLTAENQSLKFAASQQAQNNFLVNALRDPCPVPAYVVPNPNAAYYTAFANC